MAREIATVRDDAYWEAYQKFELRHDPVGQLLVAAAAWEHREKSGISISRQWEHVAQHLLMECPRLAYSTPAPSPRWSVVCFDPSGRLVAAGGEHGVIELWDVTTGRQKLALLGHFERIIGLSFTSDGATVASGSVDGTLRLWDVASGRERARFCGPGTEIRSACLAPNGNMLAAGGQDGEIRVYDVITGRVRSQLNHGGRAVSAICFSPDGTTLASRSVDPPVVNLWDAVTGDLKAVISAPADKPRPGFSTVVAEFAADSPGSSVALSFSPDGTILAVGSSSEGVELWDVADPLRPGGVRRTRTLSGYSDDVMGVSFSPDGRTLASANREGTVRLWDLRTGKGEMLLRGHSDAVTSVSSSPDGATLVSGSDDRSLRLWDVVAAREKATLDHDPASRVSSICLSPDAATLLSVDVDGAATLWDVATGQQRPLPASTSSQANSASFSPDGTVIAFGNQDGTVTLWDIAKAQAGGVLRGHRHPVLSVAFSPDGTTLVSAGGPRPSGNARDRTRDACTLKLWDVANHRERATLKGHTRSVTSACFSPDGSALASGGADGKVKLWNVAKGTEEATLQVSGPVDAVTFSPDGGSLATGGNEGLLELWDLKTRSRKCTFKGHWGRVHGLAFTPDGHTLVSGGDDGTVRLWDVATQRVTATPVKYWYRVDSMALSPDGQTLAAAGPDGTIKFWDLSPSRETMVFHGHKDDVVGVRISPDGRTLASRSRDGTLRLWDAATGLEKAEIWSGPTADPCLSFSPDGRTLAARAGDGGVVKRWDAATGREQGQFRAQRTGDWEEVWDLVLSPDGTTLAAVTHVGARLVEVATGRVIVRLKVHSEVSTVSFSPDGRRVASSGKHGPLQVWSVPAGRQETTLMEHGEEVVDTAFSPDGRLLAAITGGGTGEGTVKVWDVATGQRKPGPRDLSAPVTTVRFSPDGKTLATGDRKGKIRLWDSATGLERPMLKPLDRLMLGSSVGVLVLVREVKSWPGPFSEEKATVTDATELARRLAYFQTSMRRSHPRWLSCMDIAWGPGDRVLALGGSSDAIELWEVLPMAPVTLAQAIRSTGRRLEGFVVAPLPLGAYSAARHFVASDGFQFAPSRMGKTDPNCYLEPRWGERHPSHWVPGARRGDAMALHRLAVIREGEDRFAEARKLHERAAAVSKPAQRKWADESRWRLDYIPWLQPWWEAFKRARACFKSERYEAGMAIFERVQGLGARDRDRLASALTVGLVGKLLPITCRADDTFGSGVPVGYQPGVGVEHGPVEAVLYYMMGRTMEAREKETEAVQHYERAIALNPEHAMAHCRLARILQDRRRLKEATSHYEKALSFARDDVYLWRSAAFPLFQLLRSAGQRGKAINVVSRWVKVDPSNAEARTEHVILLVSAGRFQDAHDVLEPLVSLDRPMAKALILAVLCERGLGRLDEASARLRQFLNCKVSNRQAALNVPSSSISERSVGSSAIADLLDKGIEIGEHVELLLKSQPALRDQFRECLVEAWRRRILGVGEWGDKAVGLQICRKLLQRAPDVAAVQRAAGYAFVELAAFDDAAGCLSRLVELEPDRAVNHADLGRALYLAGRYDEAMAAHRQALAIDSKLCSACANVGLLCLYARDIERAVQNYERSFEAAQEARVSTLEYLLYSSRLGHKLPAVSGWKTTLENAIADALALLKKRPDVVEAHYALGLCYEKNHEKTSAREHYQKYVDAVKEGKFVEKAKTRIAELRGTTK